MTLPLAIISFMIVFLWFNPDSAGEWLRKAKKDYDNLNDEQKGGSNE